MELLYDKLKESLIQILQINIVMTHKSCYESCNQIYTSMQPQRLFCKKGCDSEGTIESCKTDTCNKLCIKQQQGDHRLWFKFLYRAPTDPGPCLEACIVGCNRKQNLQ